MCPDSKHIDTKETIKYSRVDIKVKNQEEDKYGKAWRVSRYGNAGEHE